MMFSFGERSRGNSKDEAEVFEEPLTAKNPLILALDQDYGRRTRGIIAPYVMNHPGPVICLAFKAASLEAAMVKRAKNRPQRVIEKKEDIEAFVREHAPLLAQQERASLKMNLVGKEAFEPVNNLAPLIEQEDIFVVFGGRGVFQENLQDATLLALSVIYARPIAEEYLPAKKNYKKAPLSSRALLVMNYQDVGLPIDVSPTLAFSRNMAFCLGFPGRAAFKATYHDWADFLWRQSCQLEPKRTKKTAPLILPSSTLEAK